MPGTMFPFFTYQFLDNTGTRPFPAAGYLLHQYESGTTDDQDTFTDPALTVLNEHPIELDSAGKCTMFADPELIYTFVLTTPAGVPVDTWDDVQATPLPAEGDFLPLDGGTMEGPIVLEGDATEALNPVTKQQMETAIAASAASLTAAADAATAAAAAATAAAAAIKPAVFVLASASGTSVTRSIDLAVGTYSVILQTNAQKTDSGSSTYDITVTQSATVGGTTVGTSFHLIRAGSSGYGRTNGNSAVAVGSLVVGTAGTFTMAMAAASLGGSTSMGSTLIVALQ